MIRRIAAIVRADFLIRFRRVSTVVVFLLLSAMAYLWVPAPSTGRTLMQIDGKRVLYNSPAIAMATAMLASMFIGLAGYYVVSNAVRKDVASRCGVIIASTTMRNWEYIAAKFLGNLAFLATFTGGYMAVSMLMQLIRGEAPLEPMVFLNQYGLTVTGTLIFVSVLAIVFECVPWLSGRFGDVAYFFFWAASFGAIANTMENGGRWGKWIDFTGLGFLMVQVKSAFHTNAVSIGSSDFDPKRGIAVFHGFHLTPDWIAPRLTSTVAPLLLLPIALLFFHRFDPTRTRQVGSRGQRGWIARLQALARPLARPIVAASLAGSGSSLTRSILADAGVAVAISPAIVVAGIVCGFIGLFAEQSSVMHNVVPIAIALAGIFIADMASREARTGTIGLVDAAPRLQKMRVVWKWTSALVVTLLVAGIPVVRAALYRPASAPALIVGVLFVSGAATASGLLTSNPKTFLVLFLTLWYGMMNDHTTAAVDFAGTTGMATPATTAVYAGITLLLLMAAEVAVRRRAA